MEEYKTQFEEELSKDNSFSEEKSLNSFNNDTFKQQNYNYNNFGLSPEKFEQKKKIRGEATGLGVSLLIVLGISLIWVFLLLFVMGKAGFTKEQVYSAIKEPAVLQCCQIVLSILMFTVPFIIVSKTKGRDISSLIPLNKPQKGMFLPLFMFGIAFCAFANLAVSSAGQIFENFGFHYSVDLGENPSGTFGFLLVLISTAIVPALVEEFAFRGIVLGSLRKFGDAFAIITSSVLFGLIHGNFEQIPFAFLVGLVLAFVTVKSGSIMVSMAIHSFNNLISVLFDYINVSNDVANIINSILFVLMLLSGIVAVYIINRQGKDIYKLDKNNEICSEKEKYKWFFTSPVIIVFISLVLIESIQFFFV